MYLKRKELHVYCCILPASFICLQYDEQFFYDKPNEKDIYFSGIRTGAEDYRNISPSLNLGRWPLFLTRRFVVKSSFREAGCALVSLHTDEARAIEKVTIVSSHGTFGSVKFVSSIVGDCRTKEQMLAELIILMGGKAAEHIVFGELESNQAVSPSIFSATSLAVEFVTRYAMNVKIGPIYLDYKSNVVSSPGRVCIENEARKLIQTAYEIAEEILLRHPEELLAIALALLERGVLSPKEIDILLEKTRSGLR